MAGEFDEWILGLLRNPPLKEASVAAEVALATNEFRMPHGDPADAFLAATAKIYDLVLVTSDAALLGSKKIATMANR